MEKSKKSQQKIKEEEKAISQRKGKPKNNYLI